MWALDRFANNNSSQASLPSSRAYSPSPRRSNLGPGRPPLSTRESSISLASPLGSQVNLASTARLPPRTSSKTAPPPDVEDPIAALERVIGKQVNDPSRERSAEKPAKFEPAIGFGGLSLHEFADRGASAQGPDTPTLSHSNPPIEEYENQREKFEDLHKSINGCDDVLQSIETYLSSFQADLAAVSAEIETLQSRSTGLNDKLDNRRKVEKMFGPTVERLALPPNVVRRIVEGPVDESFVLALDDLQRKSRALDSATDLKDVKAAQDLGPILEDLSNKAVERIRDYFAAQIRALRSPNINAQIIQQQRFLRFQSLYAFLVSKQPQLGTEIMQAYANTMRWYYESHFVRYHASLSRLKLFGTDRHDLLGEDATVSAKARGNTMTPRTDNFSLARRLDILKNPASTAMPSHAAEETKASHHFETPFLAYNLALVDNASFEYSFLTTFFSSRSTFTSTSKSTIENSTITRTFSVIFSPVINIATTLAKDLINDTYDALGVLILIRIMQHFAFVLQRRKAPTLEAYVNGVNMLLWPRFQSILDANCTSLKQLTNSLPNRQSGASNAAGTLLGTGGSGANTAPHPVTQRFANFIRGVIDLSSETGDDEPVSNSLSRLRADYEAFLNKLGASLGSGEKAKRERNRLLTNNYTLILAVLGDAKGRLAEEMKARFEDLKQSVS